MIFDTFFLYTYGSKLETASPKFSQPGDFLTYVLFLLVSILVGLFSLIVTIIISFYTSHYLPA